MNKITQLMSDFDLWNSMDENARAEHLGQHPWAQFNLHARLLTKEEVAILADNNQPAFREARIAFTIARKIESHDNIAIATEALVKAIRILRGT